MATLRLSVVKIALTLAILLSVGAQAAQLGENIYELEDLPSLIPAFKNPASNTRYSVGEYGIQLWVLPYVCSLGIFRIVVITTKGKQAGRAKQLGCSGEYLRVFVCIETALVSAPNLRCSLSLQISWGLNSSLTTKTAARSKSQASKDPTGATTSGETPCWGTTQTGAQSCRAVRYFCKGERDG